MSSRLVVEVGARGSSSSLLEISYDLLETPLAKIWRTLLSTALVEKREIADGGVFFGSKFHRRDNLITTMKETIQILGEKFGPVFSGAPVPSTSTSFRPLGFRYRPNTFQK